MRVDQELMQRGLCESRTEAQELIALGNVFINGEVITKQARNVLESDELIVTSRRRFVSRGGDKLEGALLAIFGTKDNVEKNVTGKIALDVGSSTGGFTDCLLQYGTLQIDAVDVGTNQLHEKMRQSSKVTSFENTDIRNFIPTKLYDIVVADLSFIPLDHVFKTVISFGQARTKFFFLIKPQFEVGRGNTRKGIVKDEALVSETLLKYELMAKDAGLQGVTVFPCKIAGGDGNQEYFLYGFL